MQMPQLKPSIISHLAMRSGSRGSGEISLVRPFDFNSGLIALIWWAGTQEISPSHPNRRLTPHAFYRKRAAWKVSLLLKVAPRRFGCVGVKEQGRAAADPAMKRAIFLAETEKGPF